MIIRKINEADSRKEISNIYEQSWKYAYKGIFMKNAALKTAVNIMTIKSVVSN